ncbi:MAG TPA: Hsp20/alpha crystallin family protein [Vicinamibacterales bacterium]|jgi:HSP20 family protein|nr:Hsp20/alpha crystallin family protein [Vicinamibacterales bacterium]
MFTVPSSLAAEVRRIFEELDRAGRGLAGECAPAVDVYEMEESLLVVVDLPGVPGDSIRALAKDGMLVVAGEKPALACTAQKDETRFHLAERGFGRFVRIVMLPGAFDAAHAAATLDGGELRITVPRIVDRRGTTITIQINASSDRQDPDGIGRG